MPPSGQVEIDGQVFPLITDQELSFALSKLAVVLAACGGHGTITQKRVPTGVPDESVTVDAVITWMPMTTSKSKPEPDAREEMPADPDEAPPEAEPEATLPFGESGPTDDGIGDGLEYDPDGEDVSEVPAHALG